MNADAKYHAEQQEIAKVSAPWQREHLMKHLTAARMRTSTHDPEKIFVAALQREKDDCGLCRAHVRTA